MEIRKGKPEETKDTGGHTKDTEVIVENRKKKVKGLLLKGGSLKKIYKIDKLTTRLRRRQRIHKFTTMRWAFTTVLDIQQPKGSKSFA